MRRRFPFVAIEGLDGTGKTTLRKGIFRLWSGVGNVTPLCVLGTNHLDVTAAKTLLRGKYSPGSVSLTAYLDAVVADKEATLEQLVRPNLEHRPVICDRWILSDLAFLEARFGLAPLESYTSLQGRISRAPDLTFFLELAPESAVARSSARQGDATRGDWDRIDVQERVLRAYETIVDEADLYPAVGEVVRLDASVQPWRVLHQAWEALTDRGWFAHTRAPE